MHFTQESGLRFFSATIFVSLLLIPDSFGLQEETALGKQKNHVLPLSLIGVVVSEDASSSVATIENQETGRTILLKTGERISDFELTHVLKDGIVLKKGEKIYWLFLRGGVRAEADNKIRNGFKQAAKPDQPYNRSENVGMKSHPLEKEFIRSEVQKRVKREWPLIIKDTHVVPNFANGKISGFRVVGLPEKSITSEIGICKDDVIREVNGKKLDSLSALLSLYHQVFAEDRFEVLIERNKKIIRQVYTLK